MAAAILLIEPFAYAANPNLSTLTGGPTELKPRLDGSDWMVSGNAPVNLSKFLGGSQLTPTPFKTGASAMPVFQTGGSSYGASYNNNDVGEDTSAAGTGAISETGYWALDAVAPVDSGLQWTFDADQNRRRMVWLGSPMFARYQVEAVVADGSIATSPLVLEAGNKSYGDVPLRWAVAWRTLEPTTLTIRLRCIAFGPQSYQPLINNQAAYLDPMAPAPQPRAWAIQRRSAMGY